MMNYAADSHSGNKRKLNEDCYEADPKLELWLVADGVGGHASGEVASEITRATIKSVYSDTGDLVNAVESAHAAVLDAIERKVGGPNMGSTVVAAALNNRDYQIAWVGDSRAYLWNGQKLNLLTTDHSMVEALVAKGVITREEAHKHPKRNIITQSIGVSSESGIKVDTVSGSLASGERLLLCSDGLNDELKDHVIAEIMLQNTSVEDQIKCLIEGALDNGGRDNITVIVIDSGDSEGVDQSDEQQVNSAEDSDLDLHTVVMASDTDSDMDSDLDLHTVVMSSADNADPAAVSENSRRGVIGRLFTAIKNIFK